MSKIVETVQVALISPANPAKLMPGAFGRQVYKSI